MPGDHKIRYAWLKAMYIYTIIGAGGFGLGIIVMPAYMRMIFNWPAQDYIFNTDDEIRKAWGE